MSKLKTTQWIACGLALIASAGCSEDYSQSYSENVASKCWSIRKHKNDTEFLLDVEAIYFPRSGILATSSSCPKEVMKVNFSSGPALDTFYKWVNNANDPVEIRGFHLRGRGSLIQDSQELQSSFRVDEVLVLSSLPSGRADEIRASAALERSGR